jgi:hypothetical protein
MTGPGSLGSREQAFLALARREVTPDGWREFAPLTRGPIVALLTLCALGIVMVAWLPWRWLSSR